MSYLSDDEWEVVKEPLDMEGTDNLEHSCLAPGVKCLSPPFSSTAVGSSIFTVCEREALVLHAQTPAGNTLTLCLFSML